MDTNMTSVIITILIFSGIAIGLTGFMSSVYQQYGVYDDLTTEQKNIIHSLNVTQSIYGNITDPMRQKLTNPPLGILDTVYGLVTSLYDVVKLLMNIPGILGSIIGGISLSLGPAVAPGWAIGIIIAIIIVFVLLSIVAILLKVSDI